MNNSIKDKIEYEQERLNRINEQYEINKKKKAQKHKFLIFISICSIAVSAFLIMIQIQVRQADSFSRISLLRKIPVVNIIVEENLSWYLKNYIRSHDVSEIYDKYEEYKRTDLNINEDELFKHYIDQANQLEESKNAFYEGQCCEDVGSMIQAMEAYQRVSKSDSNYRTARQRIDLISNQYFTDLIAWAYSELALTGSQECLEKINSHFEKAFLYFPKEKKLESYRESFEKTGNPLCINVIDTYYDNIRTIEKDPMHTSADCESTTIYAISNGEYLFAITFHNKQGSPCIYYYQIIVGNDVEKLSSEKFEKILYDVNSFKKVEIMWDSDIKKSEKQNRLLEAFSMLSESDNSQLTNDDRDEINEVNASMNKKMEQKTESDRREHNTTLIAFLLLLSSIGLWIFLKNTIRGIFSS